MSRKNFGAKPFSYPQPVLIIGTYDEDGAPEPIPDHAYPLNPLRGVLALYRYVRGRRAFITGGFFVAMGCSTMLIEFFEHITFDTPMFKWSLFTTAFLSVIGLFFIIAGIIRPVRDYLERRFFV